jgi:glycosyltransferase involved in cell wall biosynthesis
MPEISVIIPTFNRANLLRKAIDSVLAQESADFEIVISDNCSTDETPEVVAQFLHDPRIRYSRNDRNLGMVGNWKKAIFELARAEWFVLMSDDDFLTDPTYLSRAADAVRTHNPVFVYAGGVVQDTVAGTVETVRLPFDGLVPGVDVFASRGLLSPQDAILCNMVFNKASAARLGFLSNPDNLSCDSELYLMLCAEGPVYAISDPVCVYLKHGANLVDRIRTSRTLIDNNLDHLVRPYAYARQRGMPADSVAQFRRNTGLDRSVSSTLLRLWLHDPSWYRHCRNRMAALCPELVTEVEDAFGHRLKRAVLSIGRNYFRNRYPLIDEQAANA